MVKNDERGSNGSEREEKSGRNVPVHILSH